MSKHSFIILLLTTLFSRSSAQLEADNWIIGGQSYYTFNRASYLGTASFPGNTATIGAGAITQSDQAGKLMFYTDLGYLYNKNHQFFPAMGSLATGYTPLFNVVSTSISQPTLCVPYPGHDSLFIIFHINCNVNNNYQSGLYYSIVNVKLDNGLGDVVPGQKNIPLLGGQNVQFKLTSAQHCNKKDIWVIGHLLNSSQYFSLLVTQNGVAASPVYFSGNFVPNPYINSFHKNNMGCMKVSPLGDRLGANFQGAGFTELWNFNNSTGIGTNLKKITFTPPPGDTVYSPADEFYYGPYGIEFAPSGNLLYIVSNYTYNSYVVVPQLGGITSNRVSYVQQYNAGLATEAQVQASQLLVSRYFGSVAGAIQLANTGKIYIANAGSLSEIPYPENYGSSGINLYMLGSGWAGLNLPIFPQSYFKYPVIATGNCRFQNISFSIQNPVNVSSVLWDFGDPASGISNTSASFAPTHIFSAPGMYTVKAILQNSNGCGADTIRKVVYAGEYKVFLGNDTSFCRGDSIKLRMSITGASNTWSNGSSDTAIVIKQPGVYWVKVGLGDCMASDTVVVAENNLPQFTLGNDTLVCNNSSIVLQPSPLYPGSTYLWSNNTTLPVNTVNSSGQHWLQLLDNNGCKWRDTMNVSFKTLPNYSLGNDTAICQADTVMLNATVPGAGGYLWNTGAATPAIKAFASGIYWCDVNKEGCVYRDSVYVTVKPMPIVNLGSDTTLCEGAQYLLNVTNLNATYLWQDGSVNPFFNLTAPGTYRVKVLLNGCEKSDTVNIRYDLNPRVELGPDLSYCAGMQIVLKPEILYAHTQVWQNGSTTQVLTATKEGWYAITVLNSCGAATDSVQLVKGVCKLYVPSAFSPNGDGVNDVFKAKFGEGITRFRLVIYNRWGQQVFYSENMQVGWNGQFSGTNLPSGAYAWTITFQDVAGIQEQRMNGTVLLVR